MGKMKIAIGADHGGYKLKKKLVPFLERKGHKVADFGSDSDAPCDYPIYGHMVAEAVSKGRAQRGILVCKSGIGLAIVANKLPKVRAAVCHSLEEARLSRLHNDVNVIVFGSKFINEQKARKILCLWLNTKFEGGRHRRRVNQILGIERRMGRSK